MSEKIKAAVYMPANNGLPGFGESHKAFLAPRTPGIDWRYFEHPDRFFEALPDSAIAVVWNFKKEWLKKAGKLKLLATPAAGRDWVEVKSGNGLEVIFGEFHGELMGETVVGLMLAFCRGIYGSLIRQGSEPWARGEIASSMRQLRGSGVTILGFGHIGKWIARLLKPFGVRIAGVNRSDMTVPGFFEAEDGVYPLSALDSLLPDTEHLVVVLPGEPSSDRIVDARRLALLPKSSYLYNVGRGNAVDAPALVAALRSGALAGAGLDVFETEPLPADSPLRDCPNVVLMPHVSAFAPNYLDIYMKELLRKVAHFFPDHTNPDGAEGE